MKQTQINVEVHCVRPGWIATEDNRYRIYVNDELLTERTWVWDREIFIDENIWALILPETMNSIRLETIRKPENSIVIFALKNLRINDRSWGDQPNEQSEISFHL